MNYRKFPMANPFSLVHKSKSYRMSFLIFIILICPILINSCSCHSTNTSYTVGTQSQPYFLVEKNASNSYFLASLPGKLIIDDSGYIRMDTGREQPLIIWPFGYSLQINSKDTTILTSEGQVFARIGDTIHLGGGFTSLAGAEERLGYFLPADISGPYYLALPQYSPSK
jgi:hypothetical protein